MIAMLFRPIAAVVLAATTAVLLVAPAPALAGTTITVAAFTDAPAGVRDGACSLREAVLNADFDSDHSGGDCVAGSGADRIVFSGPGTVALTTTLPPLTDSDGLVIDGGGLVTLSGSTAGQIMTVSADAVLEVAGLRIERGLASLGGAIFNLGRLTIRDSALLRNQATVSGGAVWNGGVLKIIDSELSSNAAEVSGGAVYSNDDAAIAGSTLSLNRATLGGAVFNQVGSTKVEGGRLTDNRAEALGGAIYNNRGGMGIFDAVISDNHAGVAGGAAFNDGTLNITRDTLIRNDAGVDGGALYSAGSVVVASSVLADNDAGGSGGAVYAKSSVLGVRNSELSRNEAAVDGGGIHGDGAAMNIGQTLLSANAANRDGGAVSSASGTALISASALIGNTGPALYVREGSTSLSYSTVAANSGGGAVADQSTITYSATILSDNVGPNCTGAVQDYGYNLDFAADSSTSCGFSLHQVVGDPQLRPLDTEGGPGPAIAPGQGSDAVDAVPSGVGRCGTSAMEDLRGVARPQQGACDIGAVEIEQSP